jgi:2-oxoisovalerate dehydrogenase E2 component (dihydrolipoyl transacylase)
MTAFVFKLPDVGEGIAEAEVIAWHVRVGEQIAEDQPLVDVMTDKATVELTSPVAGLLVSLHGAEGDLAAVGSPLAVIETGAATSSEATAQAPAASTAPEPAAPARAAPVAMGEVGGDGLASPAVRQRAAALGFDLTRMSGRGPEGRIEHADLDALLLAGRGPAAMPQRLAIEEIKVIGLRRRIAEKMQESKRRIPHFSYVEEVDVTALEALRAHLNAADARPRLTLLPFLIRALVKVVPQFPQVNALYDDEAGIVRRHAALHVGIATQTPDGLVVPVVRHAEAKDLWALAAEIGRLATLAKAGKAAREDLSGSTLTLTSLGALGGVVTTPVINRPEVAIIGPNRIVERPMVREERIEVRKMMNLSSSFDHRVVDGYDAAAFIQALRAALEQPATLFMA